MGIPVVRLTDTDTGHDACPPTQIIAAASKTNVNNLPLGRITDPLGSHGCVVHPTHGRTIAGNCSATVFCEGLAVAKIGSTIDCGGSMAVGSPNVNVT